MSRAEAGGAPRSLFGSFEQKHIALGLSTGLLAGLLALVASVTSTLFIFAGPLQESFPVGLAMTLMSSVIFGVVSAASGARSFSILRTQEVAIANLGVMALALHAAMRDTHSREEIEATVIALCALGAAFVGTGLYAIGRFSLTRYLRFVPDCVVSGYLASVGFLLLKSGVLALAGADGFQSTVTSLSNPDAVSRLCGGGFLALLLLIIESRSRSRLAAPLLILAAIGCFQIVIRWSGLSIDSLERHGWVVANAPKELQNLPPLAPARLREVDWIALLGQAPSMVFLVLTSALGEMLALSGIERVSPKAQDVDAEFKNAGAANLLVAPLGAVPGFHSTVHTLLALRFRAPRRIVAAMIALVCLLALVSGKPFLQLMPWPLFGGMLIWMGVVGLKDWFFRGLLEMKSAHAIVKALILSVVVAFGFYQGMVFGALAGAFLFILEYARTGVVRLQISGREYHSSLTQFDDRRLAAIKELGDAIVILRLKGYVFFGSAHGLRERVQDALASDRRLECIVIDFEEVAGVDGAAAMTLEAIGRDARAAGVEIVFCGLSEEHRRSFAGLGLNLSAGFHLFSNLEQGLRYAEDEVFSRHRPSVVAQDPVSVFAWLVQATGSEALAARLAAAGEAMRFAPGEAVIVEGQQSDELYVVAHGEASVEMTSAGGGLVQLAIFGPGALFGELAYLLRTPRSATVRAKTELDVWRLSRSALDSLGEEAPAAALAFQHFLAARLADRVLGANRLVRYLSR
ncbi:cyclic nucleotide-binding domain-containing protein [Methylocystis bryophila]|uniref:cyclic nucleotide-binding domain-containing protein n=1 Tax=Methylocystis bryophila TaxID=655015 RepID=UPI00131A3A7D|nr:cyclic nucleotide-binding domain-containing protein [Methylocystis bryophila]BDV40907.1 sulfate permease [Methylocystis bryophila]